MSISKLNIPPQKCALNLTIYGAFVFDIFSYSEEVSTNSDQWLTIMLINIIIKNPSNGDNMSIRIDKCHVNSSKNEVSLIKIVSIHLKTISVWKELTSK